MNLFAVFLTGLTTGGLSCLALQGGLLSSVIANQKEQEATSSSKSAIKPLREDLLPVGMFLMTKLLSHTILGFLLGWFGSVLTLSLGVRIFFQLFAAFFMFATAMNLLEVHPIFRYFVFQPPKFLLKFVRNTSQNRALFAPGLMGFFTILIPCGVTQAMEVLAISSGSPIQGALIMFAFVLGTSPLFTALGIATARLAEGWFVMFKRVSVVILIGMALWSLNGVLLVLGSPLSFSDFFTPLTSNNSGQSLVLPETEVSPASVQKIVITINANGYVPRYIKVKKGVPVELTLRSQDIYSCALSFVLREFNISVNLKPTDTKVLKFTPTKAGKYKYTCSMGMYSGILEVL